MANSDDYPHHPTLKELINRTMTMEQELEAMFARRPEHLPDDGDGGDGE